MSVEEGRICYRKFRRSNIKEAAYVKLFIEMLMFQWRVNVTIQKI